MKNLTRAALAAVSALALLASCGSAPRERLEGEEERGSLFSSLSPGAQIYAFADVPASRPFLDELLASRPEKERTTIAEVLDKTVYAAAGLYPAQTGRRFHAVLAGAGYPAAGANFALGMNRAWRREKSAVDGLAYWYAPKSRLALRMTKSRVLLSDAEPVTAEAGPEPAEGFFDFAQGAAAAGWAPDASPLQSLFARLQIPIQIPANRLLFAVFETQDGTAAFKRQYSVTLRLDTPSASQAKALGAIFRLVQASADRIKVERRYAAFIDILLANPPEVDGSSLVIRTAAIDTRTLALLFGTFLI